MAYNTAMKKGESQAQYYKRLAKAADQRLVRLEGYSKQEHYEGITSYAYARAQRDILHWSGSDSKRFNTKPPENPQQLQAKINDIKAFLEAPTSTKSGVTNIYKKRADTFNAHMRETDPEWVDFTWQELADYWENQSSNKMDAKIGYKTFLKAWNKTKRYTEEELADDMVAKRGKNTKISANKVEEQVIKNLVKKGIKKGIKALL